MSYIVSLVSCASRARNKKVRELRQRCANQDRELPEFLREFVERYAGPNEGVQLPLPIRL